MKFPQLPIGARFRYRGEIYCKTSPLSASGPGGAPRLIPRSASVELLSSDDGGPADGTALSPRQRALTEYHDTCRALLREAATSGPAALESLETRLDQAHAALVVVLD